MNKIETVVFPIAGLGTRFLPYTKTIPKEFLPINNKPLIHYSVNEAINSGLKNLIFVVGKNRFLLENYFSKDKVLESFLKNSSESLKKLKKNYLPSGVNIKFVEQKKPLGLGNAILCAEKYIVDKFFAVVLPDDLIYGKTNDLKNLILTSLRLNRQTLLAKKINKKNICNYGIIKTINDKKVEYLIEKPKINEIDSDIAIIGRYVLDYKIFKILKNIKHGKNKEIQLTDALNVLIKNENVNFLFVKGRHYDCGSLEGYKKAYTEI